MHFTTLDISDRKVRFYGTTALVTSLRAIAAGAETVLVGRDGGKAGLRLGKIAAAGGRAWFHAAEASSKKEMESLLETVLGRSGRVFGGHLVGAGQGGSIINIGSMSGLLPLSRVFTYSAAKAAVHNLSRNLAREWAPHRVRVNTLVPGFFPAEQTRGILKAARVASIMGHTPMGRFGESAELVGATLLLAGERSGSFITGSEIVVDGGFHAMSI